MLYKMRAQWKMEFVTTTRDAEKAMKNTRYDIVISDLRMPDTDGVQFLEKVRVKCPDTIRFILSGYSDQPLQGRAVRCVHQFVSKPCDAEQLKNLISRAFALRDRLRSKEVSEVLSTLRSLPVMPKAYQEIIDLLGDPQCSPRCVGQMIAGDIGMSAKILQVVNSAFYRHASRIVDPVRAVIYLGLKTVEALVLTHGVFSKLSEQKAKDFSVAGLQQHCVRVGALARDICRAQHFSNEDLDIATMAGILHDTGKIILVSKFSEKLAEAIQISRAKLIPLYEVEFDMLNVNHAQLGGCLLDLWGLPNIIIEAATFHHEPWQCLNDEFTIISAVYLANVIDHQLCCGLGDGLSEGINVDYLEQLGVVDKWPQWEKMCLPVEAGEHEYVG